MSTEPEPTATPPEEPADAATDATSGAPDLPAAPLPATPPDAALPDVAPLDVTPLGDHTAAVLPARPLTAALLNLSGLGLGYLHLRAWVRLVVALAVTAGLVWLALPIDREPISVWWAVGYLGALGLFALDAALVARRRAKRQASRPTVWPPRAAARVAWATLAVVPLLGAAYVVTQQEVLEQFLAHDLDQAEARVESTGTAFGAFRKTYDTAYATYVRTAEEHPHTRAAERVPGLVDDLYARAKGDDECTALVAVKHFAEAETPGPLRAVADDELPGALRDCGMRSAEDGELKDARRTLETLLADHPASAPAAALPEDLATWRDGLIKKLGGKRGCSDLSPARDSTDFLAGFDSGKVSALADKARTGVPAGLLKCAVKQFQDKQYSAAQADLTDMLDSYPRAKDADYAKRLQIAAGIANVDPDAGVKLPARTEPEGTVRLTVFNYSPDRFDMVYTGPATGVVSIDPCDDCTYYAAGDAPECLGYSLTVPSTTVTIPAGDYLTATRNYGIVVGWHEEGVQKESYTADGGLCTWTHERE